MAIKTVISRSRRSEQVLANDFVFTKEMVPSLSPGWSSPEFVRNHRQKAWEDYTTLKMPTTGDEAWRRTDLHGLPVEGFRLQMIPQEIGRAHV